jgi:signal transduction histidine kinase/CheY-like chemotaxis protein
VTGLLPQDTVIVEALLRQQGFAAFELVADGQFRLIGDPPPFCRELFGDSIGPGLAVRLSDKSLFLEHFLLDAERVWSSASDEPLESGMWVETTPRGVPLSLEATAVRVLGRRMLLIQNAPARHGRHARVMQAARTASLEHARFKREADERLRLAERMEALGRLAGGVAHDFNNVLTVILGFCDLASDRVASDHPVRRDIQEIAQAGRRGANLTRQLLGFSRKQVIAPRLLHLNAHLTAAEGMLRRTATDQTVLSLQLTDDLWPVFVDPSQIDQILINLVANARDAMPGGGEAVVATANLHLDDAHGNGAGLPSGDYVVLTVSDRGTGMDDATLKNAFVPFFTTKPEGRGTGIGLATVYGIVKQNNGWVTIESTVGEGTDVFVYLPRYLGDMRSASPDRPDASGPVGGHETVLLVEDNDEVRELVRTLLERLGYVVLSAGQPFAALTLCRAFGGTIDLVVTDMVMRDLNGLELARRVRELQPEVATLFISGYADNMTAHAGEPRAHHFLAKPFDESAFASAVRNALNDRAISSRE